MKTLLFLGSVIFFGMYIFCNQQAIYLLDNGTIEEIRLETFRAGSFFSLSFLGILLFITILINDLYEKYIN
jgi:hypothetical protein